MMRFSFNIGEIQAKEGRGMRLAVSMKELFRGDDAHPA